MSLESRLGDLATAVGLDIKALSEGGGSGTPHSDTLLLEDLERRGRISDAQSQARSVVEYEDTQLVLETWDTLAGKISASHVVSGNRLYGTALSGGAAYVNLPRDITPGERFVFYTDLTLTTKLASSAIFMGMSTRAFDNATGVTAGYPDDFAIGVGGQATGKTWNPYKGSNLSAVTTPSSYSMDSIEGSPSEFPAGKYSVVFSGDENGVCFSVRHTTDDTVAHVEWWSVAQFASASKTFGKLAFIIGDTRGASGHSVGPIIGHIGSLQPPRVKTLAGQTQVGIAHVDRYVVRPGNSTDKWMWTLPKNYDPRRSAPMVVRITGAASSVEMPQRFWTKTTERDITIALLEAGYIVAGSNDGYVLATGISTNRFANDESMDNHVEMIDWIQNHYNTNAVILNGYSMGGQASLRLIGQRRVPNIAAAWLMAPGTDWSEAAGVDPSFEPYVQAALGAADEAEMYSILTDPDDPISAMVRPGYAFRGIPVRIVVANDDTTCPPAVHTDPFLAKIASYASEASKKSVASGGHTAAALYDEADFLDFLSRWIDLDTTTLTPSQTAIGGGSKISALTEVTVPDGIDVLPLVSGGSTKKLSLTNLTAYLESRGRKHNASVTTQGPGFSSDTYLVGSDVAIPDGHLQAKSKYNLRLVLSKTAAGTGTPVFYVRIGTAGSTADTARCTFTWSAANTAVADDMVVDITVTFRSVGSGTTAVIQGNLRATHRLTTTGFGGSGLAANIMLNSTSGGFDSTVSGLKIGCSVNGGTSAAWSVTQAQALLENLA